MKPFIIVVMIFGMLGCAGGSQYLVTFQSLDRQGNITITSKHNKLSMEDIEDIKTVIRNAEGNENIEGNVIITNIFKLKRGTK